MCHRPRLWEKAAPLPAQQPPGARPPGPSRETGAARRQGSGPAPRSPPTPGPSRAGRQRGAAALQGLSCPWYSGGSAWVCFMFVGWTRLLCVDLTDRRAWGGKAWKGRRCLMSVPSRAPAGHLEVGLSHHRGLSRRSYCTHFPQIRNSILRAGQVICTSLRGHTRNSSPRCG